MQKEKQIIVNWLYIGLILVATMVVIGGVTRLTNSGLSMVDWKLISGAIPPLNETEWIETFKKYQQFPEYQKINKNMSLKEFKEIFLWEYIHRVFGRLIGLVFIIPFTFFLIKKWLDRKLRNQLVILLFLGAIQAFLGWYMVKSGLIDIPAVSHYRLAAHLLTAFGIIFYIYWIIMGLTESPIVKNKKIRNLSFVLIGIVVIQITLGAFVAGLKAGYLTPINGGWIKSIFWCNFGQHGNFSLLNNPYDIQAAHRFFAWFVLAFTSVLYWACKNTKLTKTTNLMIGIVILQIVLGIITLISKINIPIAIAHQLFAVILLLSVSRISYLSNADSQ